MAGFSLTASTAAPYFATWIEKVFRAGPASAFCRVDAFGKAEVSMELRQVVPPCPEELHAYSLGKCDAQRAEEIESFLADGPDQTSILGAAPEDALVRHLRGARELPTRDGPPPSALSGTFAARADTVEALAPPDVLGADAAALLGHPRYRLIRRLGQGGMGTVYLAEHRLMRRLVAIKLIRAGYLNRPHLVKRFRQEVEAAARLSHPNIVASLDADEAAGTHFLVMEHVEGESLDQRLARLGPLPAHEACACVRQTALGLECAHGKGMVHRDVKPHNLMRAADGTVKVLDFGLARLVREAAHPEGQLTTEGAVLGTPDYMAPEQARDSRGADVRADVYSLGCTLYHLLAGRVPFPGGTAIDKIVLHATARPEALARYRDDLPAGLAAAIDKMMAKKPEDRYQTPGEVAQALGPFAHPNGQGASAPLRSRSPRWLLAAVLAVTLLAGGGVALVAAHRMRAPVGEPVIARGLEAEPARIELVRRIPVAAVNDWFYNTAISQGGKYVLVARESGAGSWIDVYRVASGEKVYSGVGFTAQFLGDGEQFVLPTDCFRVYETRSGKLLRQAEQKHRGMWNFKVAPGGKHLVYWTEKGYVLFDLTRMREQHRWDYKSPDPTSLSAFHFTLDGKRLLLQRSQNEDWVTWDVRQNRASGGFRGLAAVKSLFWLFPDGKTAGAARDGPLVRLDLQTGKVVAPLQSHEAPGALAGAYSTRGQCWVRRFDDGTLRCYPLPFEGKEVGRYQLPAGDRSLSRHPFTAARLALAEDDRHAVVLATNSLHVLRLPELPQERPH